MCPTSINIRVRSVHPANKFISRASALEVLELDVDLSLLEMNFSTSGKVNSKVCGSTQKDSGP